MKTAHPHSCNVLRVGPDGRQLWQFSTGNSQVSLHSEQKLVAPGPLPARIVHKDWRALWQKKLNIAWLPAEQVFLRVVHLPRCDPAELGPMVELQLEKISPLPVNQIVWSFETIPQSAGELQTVVVILAERRVVETFLGRLENDGYLADRLDLPLLHQLQATAIDGDGAWIYLQPSESRSVCLVAWWYGGGLQQLNLLNLPVGESGAAALGDQLTSIAWAGELEGWLTSRPCWHLVADAASAAVWEPALRRWANEPIVPVAPLSEPALAALTAQRVGRAESTTNLLPSEYAARYQQQFYDRLWMGGLLSLGLVYIFAVLIYFGALYVLRYQTGKVQSQVAALSGTYTNALQLKERVRILQEQVNLKFAALDCLRAAAEKLPSELTLTSFNFSKGQLVQLRGTASAENQAKITEYSDALSKVIVNGAPLFGKVNPPDIRMVNPTAATWSFDCNLPASQNE